MASFLIYGAGGYTGGLACEAAKKLGLEFVLAGRTAASIRGRAASLDVPYRTFGLENPTDMDSALNGVLVLLNCAGPFLRTAEPLINACIRNRVHYLDVAAELDSYLISEKMDHDAKQKNVMLLPGCGGSVAMLGCLAGYNLARLATPSSLDIALRVAGPMSRGSAISASENMTGDCLQRLNGALVKQEASNTRTFDFDDGNGEVNCFPVTLPDLITIGKFFDINNIRTFVHVSGDAFPAGDMTDLPDGPTEEEREKNPYHAAVESTEPNGNVQRSVIHTVNGYTFTVMASVEAAKRVLSGEIRPGFQTPAIVFGDRFVTAISGTEMKYL